MTVEQYARNVLRISADDVCYSTTKLFHAYGLGNSLSFPLSVGACAGARQGPLDARSHLRDGRPRTADAVLLGAGAVRGDGQGAGGGGRRLLERARVRVGGRGAARGGARALAGAHRRADPRRDRVDRDAPHLLLEHARPIWRPGRPDARPGYELRLVDERGLDVARRRGRRPDGPRRQLRGLLLAPAREDPPLHARRVVPHRRPLHRRRRRPLRLPGALGRHDQGRAGCGSRRPTSRVAWSATRPCPRPR